MAYIADASLLRPGSIVRVEHPLSSSGRPTYPHDFIVVLIPRPLQVGSRIPLVGVSKIIDPSTADPAKHVEMKWLNRRGGDPDTGFTIRCHACMDFKHVLDVYRGTQYPLEVKAEFNRRFIRADRLQTVVATLNGWTRKVQSERERPPDK